MTEDIVNQLKFYLGNSKAIHVKTKTGFFNGFIVEIRAEFFLLDDFRVGELPVFFSQIERLEPFRSKE